MPTLPALRGLLSWLLIAVGLGAGVMSIVDWLTQDPYAGLGWGEAVLGVFFVGGPMAAVGLGLRSSRRSVGRTVAVASAVLALCVAGVAVMQILDPNETAVIVSIQFAAMLCYVAAFTVEVSAFTDRWPD